MSPLSLYRIEVRDGSPIFFRSGDCIPQPDDAPENPGPGRVYAENARKAAEAYWACHPDDAFRPYLRVIRIEVTELQVATYRPVRRCTNVAELVSG